MADDYTPDVADDPLVPDWIPLPGGRKAPAGVFPGVKSVSAPEGLWDSGNYGADVPGVGLFPGSEGNAKVLGGAARAAGNALSSMTYDPKSAPASDDDPKRWVTNPNKAPTFAGDVYEPGSGSNDKPPLPDNSVNVAKADTPDVWKTGAGPIPNSQYGSGGMAYAPQSSALSSDRPEDKPLPTKGGDAAPPPTEDSGLVDPFGNSALGRALMRGFKGFSDWNDQHRMQLMAMAGGLAGPHSGVGRMFTAGAEVMPQQQALNNQNATMNFLKSAGLPENLAMAIRGNPALTQEMLGQMTGVVPPKTQVIKDFLGTDHMVQWNMKTKNWDAVNTPGSGGSSDVPGGTNMSAEQWDAADPDAREASLTDKNLQGMVHALRTGGSIPGRLPANIIGIMGRIDPTWTQTNYQGEKVMAEGLNKESPSSVGGALIRGLSTFGHYADAAEASAAVGGYSGPDIPGGSLIGQAVTGGRNVLADPRLASAREQEKKQWGTATTEGTTFYANAPGSEGERSSGLKAVGDTATPAMKAGNLRGAAQQLHTKLDQFMNQVMGTNSGRSYFKDPEHQQMIQKYQADADRLDAAIAKLDPTGPEAQRRNAAQQQQVPAASQRPVTPATQPTQGTPAAGNDPLSQARQAIAAGAPRDAVIQRLKQMGINPAGL